MTSCIPRGAVPTCCSWPSRHWRARRRRSYIQWTKTDKIHELNCRLMWHKDDDAQRADEAQGGDSRSHSNGTVIESTHNVCHGQVDYVLARGHSWPDIRSRRDSTITQIR